MRKDAKGGLPEHILATGRSLIRVTTVARIKKVVSRLPGAKPKTKFKVRCSRHLYTLSLDDPDKAEKLKQTLPPST